MNITKHLWSFVVAITCGIACGPIFAVEPTSENRVTVVGVGEIFEKADMAEIAFVVTTDGLTASETVRQNLSKVEELKKRLNQAKIADVDIRSTTFVISPVVNPSGVQSPLQRVASYRVTELVRVQIRNLATFSELLDEVGLMGTVHVEEIRYVLRERALLFDKTRQLAVENARKKAESLAHAAGADVGEALNIVEISLPAVDGADVESDVSIARQTIAVAQSERPLRSAVRITYALRPKTSIR